MIKVKLNGIVYQIFEDKWIKVKKGKKKLGVK